MTADLIRREDAIDALRTCYDTEAITYTNGNEYVDYDQALDLMEQLPSADQGFKTAYDLLASAWEDVEHGKLGREALQDAVYCQVMINRIVYELNREGEPHED